MKASGLLVIVALGLTLGAACSRGASERTEEKPRMAEKPANVVELHAIRVPPASGRTEYLMVLLHGVGATAESFAPIARALAPALPTTEFLVPDGTYPFDGGGRGRQWFSVRGVTEENRASRVDEAAQPLSAWIDRELAARKLGRDRLIVLGFSQGAIMAQWLALRTSPPPAAIVALAGRLAVPRQPSDSTTTDVLLVHGTADTVMPVQLAEQAAAELEARGLDVELRIVPGLAHGVDARVLAEVKAFLSDVTAEGSGVPEKP